MPHGHLAILRGYSKYKVFARKSDCTHTGFMAGLGQAVAKVGGRSRSLGLQGNLDHILACFKALKAYGCGPQGQAVAKVAGLSRSLWDMDGFFHIDQGRNANFELLELLRPCIVLGV